MAFVTITHWTATEMTDDMMTIANEKFIPLIMSAGASGVHMVRTGELELTVITRYADAAAAEAAQSRIAEIRGQAASQFPMKMDSAHGGEVIGSA